MTKHMLYINTACLFLGVSVVNFDTPDENKFLPLLILIITASFHFCILRKSIYSWQYLAE